MTGPSAARGQIDVSLRDVEAGWSEEDEVQRYVWYVEWRALFARLEGVDREFHAGGLISEQGERCESVRRTLRQHRDILQRLDLPLPTAPLE